MRALIDYNPLTKESTYMDYDSATDRVRFIYHQDVSAILEANKRDANDDEKWKRGVKKSWSLTARIPNTVVLKWRQDYNVDAMSLKDEKKVMKLLNDPEYKFLKATSKRV